MMKNFSILEPTSPELIREHAKRRAIDIERYEKEGYIHPQEDYFSISKKYPIYAVADGVTLEPEANGKYPNPSKAGKVARIICETLIEEAEKRYDDFTEEHLHEIFRFANTAVGEYNQSEGRTKETINYYDFDLFSATAAFVLIKNKTAYWFSLCDSGVALFNQDNALIFQSSDGWARVREHPPRGWDNLSLSERKRMFRKTYRNGIDEKGELIGYGVFTGEEIAERYADFRVSDISAGKLLAIFTDGFEHYMKLPEFISLFLNWPNNLSESVRAYAEKKSRENPDQFGHERTLIMVSL